MKKQQLYLKGQLFKGKPRRFNFYYKTIYPYKLGSQIKVFDFEVTIYVTSTCRIFNDQIQYLILVLNVTRSIRTQKRSKS